MKKTTDTILRIIFIVAIFGAIGNYYYTKFKKPVAPILKSKIIKIPEQLVESPKKVKIKSQLTKKTNKKKTSFIKLEILNLKKSNENKIIKTLKIISKDLKIDSKEVVKNVLFKRVLIGPYRKKTELIKVSTKVNNLKIDSLRLKIKGLYYLHVGSFSNPDKLNQFLKFLKKHNLNKIVFMDIKVPHKFIKITISDINQNIFPKIQNFLDNNHLKYKIIE